MVHGITNHIRKLAHYIIRSSNICNNIQVAQLSQRDCAAGWMSFGQKNGRRYSPDNIGLSSTTVT